jgi:DNA-binding MarR family transcriptional regulator
LCRQLYWQIVSAANRLSPSELRAWAGFLRAHASLVRALDEELRAAHDLPLTSYDVLVQLEHAAGRRLRMRDLADAVLLSRSGLTRLVDRLERQGLVRREPCGEDARGWFAVLTDEGARALRRARPTHLDGVRRRFLGVLGDDELRRLAGVWERLDN